MRIMQTIAGKLIYYFAAFLLLFALVMGSIFTLLLTRQTTALYKQELEQKAVSIAGTLSGFMNRSSDRHGMGEPGQGGYGAYMRFLDDIAMTDVWVMDSSSQLIIFGHGDQTMDYADLPQDAGNVIAKALTGKVATGEGFSGLLGVKSITVGAPILASDGKTLGVVLLHTPIDGIDASISDGLSLMAVSMIFALIFASLAAVLLALHFTKPLRRMKDITIRLARGDYHAQTKIRRKDEFGELAATIDQLAERLDDAAQQSARLTQLRQDFVANISHELRTPVTVLRGSLEALCDGVVTSPDLVSEYHRQMLSDSIHLERLVNDLLELSRLQNADFTIEKQEINLCDVMQDAARSMTLSAGQKQLHIAVESQQPVCMILGDYGRIRQMLLIVLDNAIKFSNENETIFLRLEQIDVKSVLSVIDHGAVISPKELPVVFERFHKSQDEANKKGTGLGLSIAKQIALRHGISITVASTSDATIFRFELP